LTTDCDTDLDDFTLFQQGFTGPLAALPGMVLIPGGEFQMGDHHGAGGYDELPVHSVYVDSFYMDVLEVTNGEYRDYLNGAQDQGLIVVTAGVVYQADGGTSYPYCNTNQADSDSRIHWNGSTFTVTAGKDDHPMLEVSWYGAVACANWRSQQHGRTPCYNLSTWECDLDGDGYRLPTEAEWEYAARGGEHDPYFKYPWGNEIDGSNANYHESGDPYETGDGPWTTPCGYFDGSQTPPGIDMANGYGLYDMAGNVFEWCNDWYGSLYYSSSPYSNPRGPGSGTNRVHRGGSWSDYTHHLRCAYRGAGTPDFRHSLWGFRLVVR